MGYIYRVSKKDRLVTFTELVMAKSMIDAARKCLKEDVVTCRSVKYDGLCDCVVTKWDSDTGEFINGDFYIRKSKVFKK